MKDIITDVKRLNKPCKPCRTVEYGIEVGQELLRILKESPGGVGLAANQIGLDTSVCVINISKPIILVNPRITSKFGRIYFQEGCLSFPGEAVYTERYANISVVADNHHGTLFFKSEKDILECVCVQHEIDHLNGVTMHSRIAKDFYLDKGAID